MVDLQDQSYCPTNKEISEYVRNEKPLIEAILTECTVEIQLYFFDKIVYNEASSKWKSGEASLRHQFAEPNAAANATGEMIAEFNALEIQNLQVNDLNLLNGFYVNLEYPLANGRSVKLLGDNRVYWGNQIEIPGSGRCIPYNYS